MIQQKTVKETVYLSIFVQIITTLISLLGINYDLEPRDNILKHILLIEAGVQFIEAIFYVWVIYALKNLKIMASRRYVDWFITTPLMLFTTVIYMQYIKNKQDGNNEIITIPTFIQENKQLLFQIFLCNFGMLLFGILHELHYLSMDTAIPLGFVFFGMSFYLIYDNFAKHTEEGTKLFTFLISCWALYGLAATRNDITKNTMYNCLDVVSKNFYGLFIFYQITQIAHKP